MLFVYIKIILCIILEWLGILWNANNIRIKTYKIIIRRITNHTDEEK